MRYEDDPDEYKRQLEARLSPESIRATLGFAGLYQITHELIKHAVLDNLRFFYWKGFDESGFRYDEVAYKREVLDRAPKPFRASLLWLVEAEAITLDQADRLDAIYQHRHALAHDLLRYIVDPEVEPSVELFTDALVILKAISRFWIGIEADIVTFESLGEVDLDEAMPASVVVLQLCIDAYVAGLSPGTG